MSSGFKLCSLCLLILSFSWACAPDLDSLVAGNGVGGTSAAGSSNSNGGGSGNGSGGDDDDGGGPPASPGSCENNVKNSDETDVDCGGTSKCGACNNGLRCNANKDCSSEFCKNGRCAEPTCADGFKNQDETATDCGGSCAPAAACETGIACEVNEDCKSEFCKDGLCADHCASGKTEADETDKDCGGAECGACGDDQRCRQGSDCESLICFNNRCQAATCSDKVQNQDESDKDCGGACSNEDKACPISARCNEGADCESYVCNKGKCVADITVAADDMIDDFEDGDLVLKPIEGRAGNWYWYGDGSGIATQSVVSVSRGADSHKAMLTTGKDFSIWGSGVGVDLNNTGSGQNDKDVYDAAERGYTGLTFWARAESTLMISLVLPDGDTDAAGKICTTCDHHYFKAFQIGTSWTRYTVSFADDFKEPEPGTLPKPGPFDPSRLVSVQFRIGPGANYSLWIDDVAFVK